jgi:hypothetical protein
MSQSHILSYLFLVALLVPSAVFCHRVISRYWYAVLASGPAGIVVLWLIDSGFGADPDPHFAEIVDEIWAHSTCVSLVVGLTFIYCRRRRQLHAERSSGWCPQCAYDLRGDLLTGCPECGWNRPDDRESNRVSTQGVAKR